MAGYNIYEFRKGRRTVLVAIALVFLWDTRENGIRIQGIYTLLERKMADDDDVDVRELTANIEQGGGTAEAYHARATHWLLHNNCEQAWEDAQRATTLKPDWAPGWAGLGEAQMGLGHYRASVLAYRKALELNPGDEELQAALSIAQAVFQQTQQQKYSTTDSSVHAVPGPS